MTTTLTAPAKINLTLEILARRDDGYHTLRSLMAPIGLFDRLALTPASAFSFVTGSAELQTNNLVVRALEGAGVTTPLRVELDKRIPVGGGLGGGSSDAASVLLAAMRGELGPVPERDWIALARSLGSDVPFFLVGTGALVEGTGERLTSVGALPPWWTLIVRPNEAVATAAAYRMLAETRIRDGVPSRPRSESATLKAIDALQRADFAELERNLVNDFHDLILAAYPIVARAHRAMVAAGARNALLSGSGSCLFALFPDEAQARAIEQRLERDDAIADLFLAPLVTDDRWLPMTVGMSA